MVLIIERDRLSLSCERKSVQAANCATSGKRCSDLDLRIDSNFPSSFSFLSKKSIPGFILAREEREGQSTTILLSSLPNEVSRFPIFLGTRVSTRLYFFRSRKHRWNEHQLLPREVLNFSRSAGKIRVAAVSWNFASVPNRGRVAG